MTMPRGASRALYAGNGQATEFPFSFKVFEDDQLSVLITSPAGVTSEATGWSAELDEGGGTVTYLHNGAPLPGGWKLAIMRDMPFVQEVDLITGTRFDPEVIETALDVATAERQQLLERLGRAIVVEPTDEGGPEALLADIRDARTASAASATSAAANANAAADSAQSAAGSAAIATEQREAACICAQESQAARDVAIAQAEAVNTLMETELGKVNAIVAANKTDQQTAVTAARAWAEKEADVPVDYDEDGNPLYSARHWAENAQKIAIEPPTAERRGAIRVGAGLHLATGENGEQDVLAVSPDGVTTQVDAAGLLTALGGNLLLNSEEWITESGEWEAPVSGWYEVLIIGGGDGGTAAAGTAGCWLAYGGKSGGYKRCLMYLHAGDVVPVTIGAGGIGRLISTNGSTAYGGVTAFGELTTADAPVLPPTESSNETSSSYVQVSAWGGGFGAARGVPHGQMTSGFFYSPSSDAIFYGGGGGAYSNKNGYCSAGNGKQGGVRVRYYDPAKAGGPQPAPALFAMMNEGAPARMQAAAQCPQPLPQSGVRMGRAELSEPGPVPGEATPSAAQDATEWRRECAVPVGELASLTGIDSSDVRPRGMVVVNLYDPATGQGSVWREDDAPARLAGGLVTQEAWQEMCAERAAEERAAWLADPATEAERFEMLRRERESRLAATDYLVAPDYPLSDEQRAAVTAYRQALRDLPAQEGAPWDGGGEATPWPVMSLDGPAAEAPCA